MSRLEVVVVDTEGLTFNAQLEPAAAKMGEDQTLLRLTNGAQILVPTELLAKRTDGRYDLRLKLREYADQTDSSQVPAAETGDTVIPVIEERLKVGKRKVVQNRVQLHKYVTERTETADIPLFQEQVEVERITLNQPVDEAAPVRYEGNTVVVPLYEEVLVVSKQLMLVEEVRITTQRTERHDPQEVTLRREEVEVERDGGEPKDNR